MFSGLPLKSCLFIVSMAFFTNCSSLNSTTLHRWTQASFHFSHPITLLKIKTTASDKQVVFLPTTLMGELHCGQGSELNHQRRGSKEKYVTIKNSQQQTYCTVMLLICCRGSNQSTGRSQKDCSWFRQLHIIHNYSRVLFIM